MNAVMLWLRVAAWLVVWLVVRDWVAAREGLGHRRCAGWLDGWVVVVAVVLRLVKGRRGEAGCWW